LSDTLGRGFDDRADLQIPIRAPDLAPLGDFLASIDVLAQIVENLQGQARSRFLSTL